MKYLTYEQVQDAPSEIQILWAASMTNRPVGAGFYQETMEKYPEYFPDEIEHKRKWDAIPQEVHELYYDECAKVRKERQPSPGLMYWINHPDELAEYEAQIKSDVAQEQLIYDRIYGPYLK